MSRRPDRAFYIIGASFVVDGDIHVRLLFFSGHCNRISRSNLAVQKVKRIHYGRRISVWRSPLYVGFQRFCWPSATSTSLGGITLAK